MTIGGQTMSMNNSGVSMGTGVQISKGGIGNVDAEIQGITDDIDAIFRDIEGRKEGK